MRRKHIIFVTLALLTWTSTQAAQVTENMARNIATQFMQQRNMGAVDAAKAFKAPRTKANATAADHVAFYVFNAQPGHGFVIVSGDNRTQQVIGYNDHGNFDPDNVPDAVQCWLDQYAEEIGMLDQGVVQNNAAPKPKAGVPAVAPFIKTHWGQDNPFNFECPKLDGKYCKTGSLATALAQVLYYIYYTPNNTFNFATVGGYTTTTNQIHLGYYSNQSIEWNDVLTDYTYQIDNHYNPQNIAVSKLMRYCAQKVQADFDTVYSAAFGYSESLPDLHNARLIYRTDYNKTEWENFILTELQAKRPVIYSANKLNKEAHSFICDGYDGNGYYHFNWGLAGQYDGYYLLTLLHPEANTTNYVPSTGYNFTHCILTGLKRGSTEHNSVAFANTVGIGQSTYTRNSSSEYFVIKLTASQRCNPFTPKTYDMGWGVYQDDGYSLITRYTNSIKDSTLAANQTVTYTRNLSFGKNYSDGTYYLRPICRESGSDYWLPSHHSGNNRWIRAEIQGNTLTLSTPPAIYDIPEGVRIWISSVSDIKKVGRPLELTVQVVNDSYYGDCIPIYIYDHDKLQVGTEIKVPIGTSTFTRMTFIPQESGTRLISLVPRSDFYNPNYEPSHQQCYFEQRIKIEPLSGAYLTISPKAIDAVENNVIPGNDFKVEATIKNNRESVYHDFIIARLIGDHGVVQEIMNAVNLEGNGTMKTYFSFDNLEPGFYMVHTYYYYYDTIQYSGSTGFYQVGFIKGDVNGDGKVNVSDVTALVNMILGVIATDQTRADVNGDGKINVSDVTALINIILGAST